jgi:uncharacterized protein YlxW (UPF0749 family)
MVSIDITTLILMWVVMLCCIIIAVFKTVKYKNSINEFSNMTNEINSKLERLTNTYNQKMKDYEKIVIELEQEIHDQYNNNEDECESSNINTTKKELNLNNILDKISKQGVKSLSKEEVEFLKNKTKK